MRSRIRWVFLFLDENEARKANQTAMVAEKEFFFEAPQETRGISKQKWMEDRKGKITNGFEWLGYEKGIHA
ncbi:hypothetical protein MKW98_020152 [Papaver atlanticum]|uniref:Uncharacterized protein n=1 Tax=Papaver atlanticum TaxID=357466 RepID=A0AAD4S9G4_9MAGN|nr:hypothetical protein MKW98_020152 [Papaver atlanticum]